MSTEFPKNLHPGIAHFEPLFKTDHLPPHLREVSEPFAILAAKIAALPSNPETTVALRKLLEAKDAAVRSVVISRAAP